MELDDDGASLLAAGLGFLQGPDAAPMTPDQCRWLDMDLLARFYEVCRARATTATDQSPKTHQGNTTAKGSAACTLESQVQCCERHSLPGVCETVVDMRVTQPWATMRHATALLRGPTLRAVLVAPQHPHAHCFDAVIPNRVSGSLAAVRRCPTSDTRRSPRRAGKALLAAGGDRLGSPEQELLRNVFLQALRV